MKQGFRERERERDRERRRELGLERRKTEEKSLEGNNIGMISMSCLFLCFCIVPFCFLYILGFILMPECEHWKLLHILIE